MDETKALHQKKKQHESLLVWKKLSFRDKKEKVWENKVFLVLLKENYANEKLKIKGLRWQQ